jgi:dethiobiotin synthetase
MTAIFVTATGTDIGKTFVTAGLVSALREQGRAVEVLKPVVTGFTRATVAQSDPAVLLTALGRPVTEEAVAEIAPWRFAAPLSPDMAASREGRTLDFAALVAFCREAMSARQDVLLIEGVGGVMVPLEDRRTVLDWMVALGVPVILVAGSYLGTISHTLTVLDVLARNALRVVAVVVSESENSTVSLADTVASITRFVRPIEVLALPRLSANMSGHAVFGELAALSTRPPLLPPSPGRGGSARSAGVG